MNKLSYALIITGLMTVLSGCSSSEQLTKSSPNTGYYTPPGNSFNDVYPHKDRHDPTAKLFITNHEGKLIENPNYIPKNF